MKKTSWFFLIIILLFLVTRLVHLSLLPIFNDESTYIRYGLHQLYESSHNPYSLLIGKEPLMPFLYAVTGSVMHNLLVGARLVTVVFSLATSVGLYLVAKRMVGEKAAILVVLLYSIVPYAVFFDRLALMDS